MDPGYSSADFPKDTAASRPHGAFGGEREIKDGVPSKVAGVGGSSASKTLAKDFGLLEQKKIVRRMG